MGAAAIAGVDQGGALARHFGQRVHRAVLRMPHHETAHAHGFQVAQGVAGGLALARGGGGGVEVQHVRAQPLRRDLERTARAGGRFEKERAHRGAVQQVAALGAAQRGVADLAGAIQQAAKGFAGKTVEGQQVPQASIRIDLLGHWLSSGMQGSGPACHGDAGFRKVGG